MTTDIMNNDWAQYDEVKQRQGASPKSMNLEARWELNYLANVIHTNHPHIDMDTIKIAIYAYTQAATRSKTKDLATQSSNRDVVMKWVLKRLEVAE